MARPLRRTLWLRNLEARITPTTYFVNSLADIGAGTGNAGDLRYCVGLANSDVTAGPHVIDLTSLTGTITLLQQQVTINASQSFVFNGPGPDKLTISGLPAASDTNRIFNITSVKSVTIDGLTLANGNLSTGNGGAILAAPGGNLQVTNSKLTNNVLVNGGGGAIELYSASAGGNSTLTLQGVSFLDNSVPGAGGAVHFSGSQLLISDCLFEGNGAYWGAAVMAANVTGSVSVSKSTINNSKGVSGSVYVSSSPNVSLSRCVFANSGQVAVYIYQDTKTSVSESTFDNNAGGIVTSQSKQGSVTTVSGCTFVNNRYGSGGAIYGSAYVVNVTNSTFVANTATGGGTNGGGAIVSFGVLNVSNSTIVGNRSVGSSAGGIYVYAGSLNLQSSIVANNVGTDSYDMTLATPGAVTGSSNLIGVGDVGGFTLSPTNQAGTAAKPLDPRLSLLADNGGPTKTMGLLPGSPAIDKGNNASLLTTDQRGPGFPRALNVTPDVGAFEGVLSIPLAVMTPLADVVTAGGTTPNSLTVTYLDSNAVDVSSIDIGDIRIVRPDQSLLPVTGVTVDVGANGSPRVATYSFAVPGGIWDVADNGFYSVVVVQNQVANTNATVGFADPGVIGTIHIGIPSTYVVNATNDESIDTDSKLSLREALAIANADATTLDTITFDPLVFSGPTIIALTSPLTITGGVFVSGPGADRVTLDGQHAYRVWDISNNSKTLSKVTLKGMTVANGIGGIAIADESVTLDSVWVKGNTSPGVTTAAGSRVTVLNSTISGNEGGIKLAGGTGSFLLVRNSTISTNTLGGFGQGISIGKSSAATIQNTTITGHKAGTGAGIYCAESVTLTIESSVIAGNSTADNYPDVDEYGVTGSIRDSLLGIGDFGNSLVRLGTVISGTKLNPVDPDLSPLGFYGGPTPTHLPRSASPVRGKGNNVAGTVFDQRGQGFSRTFQSAVDMGAIESSPVADAKTGLINVAGPGPNTVTVTYSDNAAIDWSTIGVDDIQVLSPTGAELPVTGVTVDASTDGPTRIATYTFGVPGGAWDPTDNGTYSISLWTGQVANAAGVILPAGRIGQFVVSVPKVILVTSLADSGPGTLRAAMQNVSTVISASTDTVTFDPALFSAGDATISLTSFDSGLDGGEAGASAFVIGTSVEIDGPAGAHSLTIQRDSAAAKFRLFHVQPTGSLLLRNVTISGGVGAGHGSTLGGGGSAGLGGAVFNQGLLDCRGVTLMGNIAVGGNGSTVPKTVYQFGGGGAGLGADGTTLPGGPLGGVYINFSPEYAKSGGFGGGGAGGNGKSPSTYTYGYDGGIGGFGGGGGMAGSAKVHGRGGTGGFGGGAGGGAFTMAVGGFAGGNGAETSLTIYSGAGAGLGGAIFSTDGIVTLVGCSFADNSASGGTSSFGGTTNGKGLGGAVFLRNGEATISNCTFSGNAAAQGGGSIFVLGESAGASLTLNSTILANSANGVNDFQSADNFGGYRILAGANNLIENNNNTGYGFTGGIASKADPGLLPLAKNGGPTRTFALPSTSPAVNAGSNPLSLATDQRGAGYPRVVGVAPDIGAYELQAKPAVVSSWSVNNGVSQRSRVTSLTVTFDRPVSLPTNPANAFQLVRLSDTAPVSLSASVASNVIVLTFVGGPVESGSLADGRYSLTVLAPQVDSGNFDGNGDTIAGDNYQLVGTPSNGLFRLFGDADGNGQVTLADILAFRLAFLSDSTVFDFDSNGQVDASDFLQFRLRFLQSV